MERASRVGFRDLTLWCGTALALAGVGLDARGQTLEAVPGLAGGIIRTHFVSGDGRKVVFSSAGDPVGRNADGNVEIFVYDVATRQTSQLTQTASQPRFNDNDGALPSYDGTRIVLRSRFNVAAAGEPLAGRDLFLATVSYAGATPSASFRRLTTTGENGAYALSADGRYVVFVSDHNLAGRNAERSVQLFRIALDPAPAIQQITQEPGGIADSILGVEVDINATGDRFVFTSRADIEGDNPEGNQEIFAARADGVVNAVTFSAAAVFNSQPRFASVDTIAFRSNGDLTGANADGNSEIFVANVATAFLSAITATTGGDDGFGGANDQLAISSDARTIVFVSNRDLVPGRNADGNREIFAARVTYAPFAVAFEQLTDTSNPHPGTRIENVWPRIDDQGLRIAFNSDLAPGGISGSLLYLISLPAPTPPTAAPRIDALDPSAGGPSVQVRIRGLRLGAASAVAFNGQSAAAFQVLYDQQILATVPSGVTDGPVTVTTPAGVATSPSPFLAEQLAVGATELSQGMSTYPAVAGKDALVRTFVNVTRGGAWAITDARLTVTRPDNSVAIVEPRMFGGILRATATSHSETENVNFFVPGSVLAQAGLHSLRVEAFTAGTRVVDRTIGVDPAATKDVVLALMSVMRALDAEEIRLLLDELAEFSRLHPVRAGLGGIRAAGAGASGAGLRIGFVFPPLFSELDGDGAIPTCVALALYHASCWDEILRQLNEVRTAFNALGDFEPIEFVSATMPRDRVISPVGGVGACAGRPADGYGETPGNATWIAMCGFTTTLAHEIGHNIGLVPAGAPNSNGRGHSVNSQVTGRNAFNLTRWQHVPDILSVMCTPACAPDEFVFFEDQHNGRPADYPFLFDQRRIAGGGASLPLWIAQADAGRASDAAPAISPEPAERWSGRRLMVNASIDRRGELMVAGVTGVRPGTRITPSSQNGPVELVILDGRGNVLRREFLRTIRGGPPVRPTPDVEQGGFLVVSAVRPLPRRAATVEIHYRGKVAFSQRAGEKPPTVAVRSARVLKGGAKAPPKIVLSWAASDPDGDALHYRIDFSRDGKLYQPFVLRTTRRELAIPTAGLPGGDNVRFRVTASDGIQSASAVSPPLKLPGHAPVAQITSLRDGQRVRPGAGIELRGLAFDLEDGLLGEHSAPMQSFVWRLDGRTKLGTGARLYARGPFKPGKHTITLEVADRSGRTARVSRSIVVEAAEASPQTR